MDQETAPLSPLNRETDHILGPTPMTPHPHCSTAVLALIHKFCVIWYTLLLVIVTGTSTDNNSHTSQLVIATGPTESPAIIRITSYPPFVWFALGLATALYDHAAILYRYEEYRASVQQSRSRAKGNLLAATLWAIALATSSLTNADDIIWILGLSCQIGALHAFLKFSDPNPITALRSSPIAWRICVVLSAFFVTIPILRIAFHSQPWWLYGCVAVVILFLVLVLLNQGLFIYQVSFWDSYAITEGIHLVVCLLCNTLFAVFLICSAFDPKDPSR